MEQKHLNQHVTKILLSLGFSPKHSGFVHLREMLVIGATKGRSKMKDLYPIISKKYGLAGDALENSLRVAIGYAQYQKKFLQIEELMGVSFLEKNFHFTPYEFISLITEYLTTLWDGSSKIF